MPRGLLIPSGHCPQVKLSGYLLGGGMSWNQGVWGYGNESVEAVELVTAEGKLITANESDNADYFWAARGAGYGFFGVATRYHLKLYPLPKAIHAISYYYSLNEATDCRRMARRDCASKLSPSIELSFFLLTAPPELKDEAAAGRRQGLPGLSDGLCGFGGGRKGCFEAFGWLSRASENACGEHQPSLSSSTSCSTPPARFGRRACATA